jgi:hypothetical protein
MDADALQHIVDTLESLSVADQDALMALWKKRKSSGFFLFLTMYFCHPRAISIIGEYLQNIRNTIMGEMIPLINELPVRLERIGRAHRIEIRKRNRQPSAIVRERNAAIVRQHDQENVSFGRMGRVLASMNPKWTDKDGKPLSRAAVEKAYHRFKSHTDKS